MKHGTGSGTRVADGCAASETCPRRLACSRAERQGRSSTAGSAQPGLHSQVIPWPGPQGQQPLPSPRLVSTARPPQTPAALPPPTSVLLADAFNVCHHPLPHGAWTLSARNACGRVVGAQQPQRLGLLHRRLRNSQPLQHSQAPFTQLRAGAHLSSSKRQHEQRVRM